MAWHGQPWHHWWHQPTTAEIGDWSAGWGFGDPLYYDYGPEGNVIYRDENVYLNNNLVGTADEYAKSAFALANASPATDSASDQPDAWLPLGTFALLPHDGDTKPSKTVQLALNKDGSISGVLFDLPEDTSTPIHGSVDRKTQRVAFDLGADSGLVAETGIYNLTQDEVTLLVHAQGEEPKTCTLVRFQSPPTDEDNKGVALSLR